MWLFSGYKLISKTFSRLIFSVSAERKARYYFYFTSKEKKFEVNLNQLIGSSTVNSYFCNKISFPNIY